MMSTLQASSIAPNPAAAPPVDLLLLSAANIEALTLDREAEIIDVMRRVYIAHAGGETVVPHSSFLRFPDRPDARIIALSAYLADGVDVAGVKWVASFPGNVARGYERASAVIVLNSAGTGRPFAILEGSLISAQRTAASAALAALALGGCRERRTLGVIGCGRINADIIRFVRRSQPGIQSLLLHDLVPSRAEQLRAAVRGADDAPDVEIAHDLRDVLANADVISFATTAITPYVADLSMCRPGAVILHVSLRDIVPEALLGRDNVVDDIDHVCRERTSVHLAEQLVGHRTFVRATIGSILAGRVPTLLSTSATVIFSPFGLGVLDIAMAHWVVARAREAGQGLIVPSFLPNR